MDLDQVLQCVTTAALPQRGAEQTAAENQLKLWESEKGFYYNLQTIYITSSLPLQTRWLAVILLKNGVEKYWRPTRINAITKEEKNAMRRRVFDVLQEPNNQLAAQNAHLISRMARFDFPNEWPTLIEDIISIMEHSESSPDFMIIMNNLMTILNQIIKMLATVRIGKTRIVMQSKIPTLFPHLVKFYKLFFDKWCGDGINNINDNNNDQAIMQVGYMFLKVIRRILVDGYAHMHREPSIQDFMELTLQHLQKLLVIHESNDNNGNENLEKYIKCYIKMYFNLSSETITSFTLLSSCQNIMMTILSLLQQKKFSIYNINETEDDFESKSEFWEKIGIMSIKIMINVTSFTFEENKRTQIVKQKSDFNEIQTSKDNLKNTFFTVNLIENITTLLFDHYLKLRPVDLSEWTTNSTEWFEDDVFYNWEFHIRKCAEVFFEEFSKYFPTLIAPFILNKLNLINNVGLDSITQDSILCIFQISSDFLKTQCDFNQLLIDCFLPLAFSGDWVLKRRVCLIIEDWDSVKLTTSVRSEIYKYIVNKLLTDSSMNTVVKLTGMRTLNQLLDDWGFEKQEFVPFLETTLQQYLQLVREHDYCKYVLKQLPTILERCRGIINKTILTEIIKYMATLWDETDPEFAYHRGLMLRVIKESILALDGEGQELHSMIVPIIMLCCDTKSELYITLSEDGLDLWAALVRIIKNKDELSYGLASPQMMEILVHSLINLTEILPSVLSLIRSYILISTEIIDGSIGEKLLEVIAQYLPTMRDDAIVLTSSILDFSIMQQDNLVVENIARSGLLNVMAKYIGCASESRYCEMKISIPLLRIMILRPDLLLQSVSSFELYLLLKQLRIQCSSLSHDPANRKLHVLGILSLMRPEFLNSNNSSLPGDDIEVSVILEEVGDQGISYVLSSFANPFITLALELTEDIIEDQNGDLPAYSKMYEGEIGLEEDENCMESLRIKAISNGDGNIVRRANLIQHVLIAGSAIGNAGMLTPVQIEELQSLQNKSSS